MEELSQSSLEVDQESFESYSGPVVRVNKCSGCHNQSWSRYEKLSNLKYFELLGSLIK